MSDRFFVDAPDHVSDKIVSAKIIGDFDDGCRLDAHYRRDYLSNLRTAGSALVDGSSAFHNA